ncbi:MAG TPA: hypothetical protein VFL90_15570 [Methylomirabilota bacterium]|nr:hypothetical protein [Methylomirabilota bacterium]
MTSRIIRLAIVAAMLALAAPAGAIAQGGETRGIVQRVDVPGATVYFTDGRSVRLNQGARLFVGSREVQLAEVQPGWTLVVPAGTSSAGPVLLNPAPTATVTAPETPARPPVDATGVVSSVDPQTGTITLQDGRVLRATGRTTIWQPVPLTSVTPGASVYVRNGEPVDFRPAAGPPSNLRQFRMGTVSAVDAGQSEIRLSDGTTLRVPPGAHVQLNGQSLAVSALRPGDEIVVGVPTGSAVSVQSGGALSALPAQVLMIEGDWIYVVRRPQAP